MRVQSAGLLLFRRDPAGLRVLLVHPGGPFWARRDDGAWTIPKGQIEAEETPFEAARREFSEETGSPAPDGAAPLGSVAQKGGKIVHAWAVEGDLDAAAIRSTTFEMEWPPKSGRTATFPEVDRAAWLTVAEAERKILPAQRPFLERLALLTAGEAAATSSSHERASG
jgi:predicted NUDIX family NTP pyrophosphohydrolase